MTKYCGVSRRVEHVPTYNIFVFVRWICFLGLANFSDVCSQVSASVTSLSWNRTSGTFFFFFLPSHLFPVFDGRLATHGQTINVTGSR